MFLVLKQSWVALNGSQEDRGKEEIIPAGRHEVELVPNPFGFKAPWLVLKGTLIGAAKGFWLDWGSPDYGESQIMVEDDPVPIPITPATPNPNPDPGA